jgi:CTP synthase
MKTRRPKFLFITGGVVSSLGKGLAGASIGALLENRGLKVGFLKLDPYINVDPGTMSPFQHGEVFVTDDGAETDLDLGHYERFTTTRMSQLNNYTSGRIYQLQAAEGHDLLICEIGGTVGDIESLPFLEAIRQVSFDVGDEDTLYMHLTLVPYIKAAGEVKTKPTQHSVKELRNIGISPDILLCRCENSLARAVKDKIALFASVSRDRVFSAVDVSCIYQLPIALYREGLDDKIAEVLNIWSRAPTLDRWERVVERVTTPKQEVTIAVVGKYVDLVDSYKSLHEALIHGGIANDCRVNLRYVDSESIESDPSVLEGVGSADGILVPGGFGTRGIEGKIRAVTKAREERIPFFGICLGMQAAVIEFARQVAGLEDANSQEFKENARDLVIALMEGQKGVRAKGGTMRLGAYPCRLAEGSLAQRLYGKTEISERHRHRFEVNNAYRQRLVDKGLTIGGTLPDDTLVEIVEIQDHPWFLGCQFHPEFKSRPFAPHPLFAGFVEAALRHRGRRGDA